jgi:mono/diheme cytochrome c family protein
MKYFFGIYFLAIITLVSILGFQGKKTKNTPIEIFPDMDHQDKYLSQSENDFFSNGMSDRKQVQNTVQRGNNIHFQDVFNADYKNDRLENPSFYSGKDPDGNWMRGFPSGLKITNELLEDGKVHYDIYCGTCHGVSGDGRGVTRDYGMLAASYHDDRIRDMSEGELFDIITNGKNLMYGLKARVKPEERWAIILYVRALQLSQHATYEDLNESDKKSLGL